MSFQMLQTGDLFTSSENVVKNVMYGGDTIVLKVTKEQLLQSLQAFLTVNDYSIRLFDANVCKS